MAENLEQITANTPRLISAAVVAYMKRRAAFLPNSTPENVLQQNIVGGKDFIYYEIPEAAEPEDYDPSTIDCDNEATTTIDLIPRLGSVTNFIRHRIKWNLWQSRMAAGGFKNAFNLTWGPVLNSFLKRVEREFAEVAYTNAANVVGEGGVPLNDETIREALKLLSDRDVFPDVEDLLLAVGTDAYWKDLLGDDDYRRYDASGENATLVREVLTSRYNVGIIMTPSVVNSSGTGGATTHNVMYHKYALGAVWMPFEPVSTYVAEVGQNVEEGIVRDDGMYIRTQKYYDPKCKEIVLEIDTAFEVIARAPQWIVDVRS